MGEVSERRADAPAGHANARDHVTRAAADALDHLLAVVGVRAGDVDPLPAVAAGSERQDEQEERARFIRGTAPSRARRRA